MIRIFGAGMAGLLAAQILRRHSPVVYETQPSLPDNHGALLRFRSDAVSRATGIPFTKVMVRKAMVLGVKILTDADLRLSNMYALKVSGEVRDRSVLNLAPVERYVAPDTFLSDLARGVTIEYQSPMVPAHLVPNDDPIISTIPMPALMHLAWWGEKPDFRSQEIWTVNVTLDTPPVHVYQTLYYPDPQLPYYRASFTGARLTIEFCQPVRHVVETIESVLSDFGITTEPVQYSTPVLGHQTYGKLIPVSDDQQRRAFILAMTDKYNIYSLGRFSTWRQILLDDVVADVDRIHRMITERDTYARRLQYTT